MMGYELLVGKEAFSDKKYKNINDTKLKMMVGEKGLRPSRDDIFDGPSELFEIIETNWNKEPEKRMTASELVESLKIFYDTMN